MAYSEEQRRSALETFIRFGHSYADTIAELGYPNRGTLRGWWREYERTGVVPVRKSVSDPTYTDAMKRAAVDYYLGHGRSLARTARALGYPKSRQLLGEWIDEYAPGQRKRRVSPVNIMDSGIADLYAASMASGSAWRAFSKRPENSCMASAGTRSPMDSCGR
ncbi:MAG: transposase [Olsenella sp.]|nr:transposase [Olsenella sp.]